MIRRIVVFKMKDFADGRTGAENARMLAGMFNDLKEKLAFLESIQAGVNLNAASDHHMGLTVVYRREADIDLYTNHPDHVVVKDFVGKVIESRIIVDYEV